MAYEDTATAPSPEDAPGKLGLEESVALVKRCATKWGSDPRKRQAWDRWLVYTEKFKPLILRRIETVQRDPETRDEISKHVDLTNNVGLDITRETSVCWKQGVRRSIADATEKQADAFREIELESQIDVHAIDWNQIASLVGPILVVPNVRKDKLRWDVILPTYSDVEPDPDDPYGCPLAAAWSLRPCEGGSRRSSSKTDTVLLDGHSWRYYSTANGQPNLIDEVVHGLGYFPGEPLRFANVYDGDWYGGCDRNQRLVDATVSVGAKNAQLSFVRKAQNKYLLSIIGDLEGLPKLQKLDPEIPVSMHAEQQQRLDLEVLNFDTSPENFIRHAEWDLQQVAATYGGSVADDGNGARKVVFSDKALTEIRNAQLPFARSFERGLWTKTVEICRVMKRPGFENLPDAEKVRNGLQLDFGKLARSFADPKQESDYIDWLMGKGGLDQVELTRRIEGTNLSDEQVWGLIERRLENQAKFNGVLATRNLSLIDGAVQGTAQTNGAMGPAVRDGTPLVIEGAPPGPQDASGFAADVATDAVAESEVLSNDPGDGAPPPDPGTDVQAQALNGAQIASFLALCQSFASGQLPFELGERFLPVAFPGVIRNEESARRILEPLRGFVPRPTPEETADAVTADAEGNDDGERESE
jgi:hypothetical protein